MTITLADLSSMVTAYNETIAQTADTIELAMFEGAACGVALTYFACLAYDAKKCLEEYEVTLDDFPNIMVQMLEKCEVAEIPLKMALRAREIVHLEWDNYCQEELENEESDST